MKTLAQAVVNQVEALAVAASEARSAAFAKELATISKFFPAWNTESQAAKIAALTRRARELQAKAKELRAGRLHTAADYVAGEVVEHVQAIRQLTGKPYAL